MTSFAEPAYEIPYGFDTRLKYLALQYLAKKALLAALKSFQEESRLWLQPWQRNTVYQCAYAVVDYALTVSA